MKTHYKLVISGNILEFYKFKKAVEYGEREKKKKSTLTIDHEEDTPEEIEEPEQYEDRQVETVAYQDLSVVYRAKREIRRLVGTNARAWKHKNGKPFKPMFLTLTFKENITDITIAHKIFMKNIKRLNYFIYNKKTAELKYLAVPEFQKRGAVHYHLICFNLPYLDNVYDELTRIWGQGHINLKPVTAVMGAIRYLSKYLSKSLDDVRLQNRKKYLTSKGLLRPYIVRDEGTVKTLLEDILKDHKKYTYHMSNVPWCEDIDYTRIVLKPERSLKEENVDPLTKIVLNLAHKKEYKKLLWSTSHIAENLLKAKTDKPIQLTLNLGSYRELPTKADLRFQKSLQKSSRPKNPAGQNSKK